MSGRPMSCCRNNSAYRSSPTCCADQGGSAPSQPNRHLRIKTEMRPGARAPAGGGPVARAGREGGGMNTYLLTARPSETSICGVTEAIAAAAAAAAAATLARTRWLGTAREWPRRVELRCPTQFVARTLHDTPINMLGRRWVAVRWQWFWRGARGVLSEQEPTSRSIVPRVHGVLLRITARAAEPHRATASDQLQHLLYTCGTQPRLHAGHPHGSAHPHSPLAERRGSSGHSKK